MTKAIFAISILFIGCTYTPPPPHWNPEALISNAQSQDLRVAAMVQVDGACGPIWQLQIIDTQLYLEFINTCTGAYDRHGLRLSDARLQQIRQAFNDAEFFALPSNVKDHPCNEDGANVSIYASVDGRKASLKQCDPELGIEYPEVKRFVVVWNEIIRDCENCPKW